MRDAFGGAFSIMILSAFLIIYLSLTALAVNYAKAFKVKNAVIAYIENNNITTAAELDAADFAFERIATSYNYGSLDDIKITQYAPDSTANKLGTYYRVETKFQWELSFLEVLGKLGSGGGDSGGSDTGYWTIVGETRVFPRE